MRLGRVRDDADGRLREPREIVDLAGVVRAELDDERIVLCRQPHQRQRHADVVVQVALRDADRAADAQDRRDELLDRRLAAAAGDGNHGDRERSAPRARHRAQARGASRGLRSAATSTRREPRHERAGGALCRALRRRSRCRRNGRRGSRRTTSPGRARACPSSRHRTTDRRRRAALHFARDRGQRTRHHGVDPEKLGDDGAVAERSPLGSRRAAPLRGLCPRRARRRRAARARWRSSAPCGGRE